MKKHTRRRRWDLDAHPVRLAMLTEPASDADMLTLRIRELQALAAFEGGTAGAQEWRDLDTMRRIAQALAADGIGPEALGLCHQARELLRQARAVAALPPQALAVLRELLAIHEAQRTSASRAQYEQAINRAAPPAARKPGI